MTAPALPGAAPDPAPGRNDPARLPPEVERIMAGLRGARCVHTDAWYAAMDCEFCIGTAIARALGGDGEPVACPECAARKPDDGDWWARHVLKAKSLAALKSIAEGWPMSRPAATGDTGEGERTLPTRGDVGRPEATRDPVFILQYRDKGRRPDSDRWRPVGVWFTREEAETFAAAHAHRWPDDRHGKRWQVYCVPADGEMARLLKAVTLRAVATPAATGGPDAR